MPRQTKYRAWDKKKNRLLPVVSIWWSENGIADHIVVRVGDTVDTIFTDFELMEYTGLKDKNGVEIYEGDIVRVFDRDIGCEANNEDENHDGDDCEDFICTQKIEWSEWGGYFCDEDTGNGCMPLGDDNFEFIVIGNIHQLTV